jgi:hypothetical protein
MTTNLNKIRETAKVYAEEFPGEPLDEQWSATAYEIAGSDETGLSWEEYHSAVEDALAKLTRGTGTYRLFWNSVDGQASLHMGEYATEQEARDAIPEAAAELEAQGGTAEGRWTIDRIEEQETATDIHAVANPSTTCPDREGAVDATVYAGETCIGEVTLLPDPGNRGRLDTWGEPSHWASDGVQRWLDQQEERQEAIDAIVSAVREAAR